MSRSKRYAIYAAVTAAMIASIFVAGFFGPIVVGAILEVCAKRAKVTTIKK